MPNFAWISPNQRHDMQGLSTSGAALAGTPQCDYPDSGLDHGAIHYVKQTVQQTMDSPAWKTTKSSIVLAR